MHLEHWTGPPVDTHGYLLYDAGSREAWAIDAPMETADLLLARVRELDLRLTRLILTHGHFDHLMDAPAYQAAGIPIALHPGDVELVAMPQPSMFGIPLEMPAFQVDEELREGDRLRLGEDEWEVWHVPGHSPGHIILHCAARQTVLGGDLLFAGGYGRVDLPGSDPAAMTASLTRLLALPLETQVHPGHGPATTVGAERRWLAPLLVQGGFR